MDPQNIPSSVPSSPDGEKWLPLTEAASHTPYSAEYLSLLARKGKLIAKKIDNVWYTTKSNLDSYMRIQMIREQVQNGQVPAASEPKSFVAQQVVNPSTSLSPVHDQVVSTLKSIRSYHDDHREYVAKEEAKKTIEPIQIAASDTKKVSASHFTSDISHAIEHALEKVIDKKFSSPSPLRHLSFGAPKTWPKGLVAFAVGTTLFFTIMPVPLVFSFFEKSFDKVVSAMNDARTVMGFRPGTHANELLLLDKNGNISIMGHIETHVQNGEAPFVVDSVTLVNNLNADYVDGLHAADFTLAYVTKNGAVTTEDVKLSGTVEVGKTLTVSGLSTLGDVKVIGNAEFDKILRVLGPAFFEGVVTAQSDLVTKGNFSVSKNASVRGSITAGQSIIGKNGSFEDASISDTLSAAIGKIREIISDDISADALTATDIDADTVTASTSVLSTLTFTDTDGVNSTTTNATTTNLFASVFNVGSMTATGDVSLQNFTFANATGTSATTTNFYAENASFLNLVSVGQTVTNLLFTNATGTSATTTNFYSDNATFGNITSTGQTITDLLFTNATGTNATTTSLFSSTASSTNLFFTSGYGGNLTSTGLGTFTNIMSLGSTTLQNFSFLNATGTSATTTNFFATSLRAGDITSTGLGSFVNLFLSGSTTLQNFTFVNATGTSATTTSFFSTVASSTNLYSSLLNIGGGALTVDSSRNVGVGTPTPLFPLDIASSSGIRIGTGGAIQPLLKRNTNTGGLVIDTNGTAIGANSLLSVRTNGGTDVMTVYGSGNVGIGTTTPGARLEVKGTGTGSTMLGAWGGDASYGGLSLNGDMGLSANFYSPYGGSTLYINRPTGGNINFREFNGADQFTIQTGGNIGVGSSTPAQDFSVEGNGYFTGGLGVGKTNTSAGSIAATDSIDAGTNLFVRGLLSCNNASDTLQTDGSGQVICGTVTAIGGTSAGGWTWVSPRTVQLATTSDQVVIGTSSSSPYAKMFITSGGTATTTLALSPVSGQTANILDIYNTSGALTSVINASGNFGLGLTNPTERLHVSGNAIITGTVTATGGLTTLSNLLLTGSTTLQNFSFVNATGTSATTTNFFSTTASSTNLFATALTAGNITSTGLGTLANLLLTGSTTLQNFSFVNATGTSATTTNLFSTTSSSTNLFATTLRAGNIISTGLGTFANLLLTGSTTLQNFSFVNATGTSATTTNFFATTASSSRLFTGTLGIGTTNPTAKLDIAATGDTTELLRFSTERPWTFRQTSSGATTALDLHSTVSDKTFTITSVNSNRAAEFSVSDTAANNRAYLVPDGGRVGIGLTNPSEALHVSGNMVVSGNSTTTNATTTNLFSTTASSTNLYSTNANIGNALLGNSTTSQLAVTSLTSGSIPFVTTGGRIVDNNSQLFWDRTQTYLGLGINTPSEKFHVSGGVALFNAASTGVGAGLTSGLRIAAPIGSSHYNWMIGAQQNVSGGFEITPSTATGGTSFSSPAFVIEAATSHIGLGINNPETLLHLKSTSHATSTIEAASNNDAVLSLLEDGTGDVGTYLRYDGLNNRFGIFTGNNPPVERFSILRDTGFVGIGTTSPLTLLHVSGSDVVPFGVTGSGISTGVSITNTTSGGREWRAVSVGTGSGAGQTGSFAIYDNTPGAGTRLLVDTSGNVGIGTTTPVAKLQVSSGFSGTTANSVSDDLIVENSGSAGLSILSPDANNATLDFGSASNNTYARIQGFYNSASPFLRFSVGGTAGSPTERARIDNDGDFGIGTTSPWGKLSVTNTGSGPSFVVEDATSPDSTPFIVDASGNVGIGIASPAFQLHQQASGSNSAHHAIDIATGGTGDPYTLYRLQGTTQWSTGVDNSDSDKFKISVGGSAVPGTGDVMTITTGGVVGIGTTTPSTSSLLVLSGSSYDTSSIKFANTANSSTDTWRIGSRTTSSGSNSSQIGISLNDGAFTSDLFSIVSTGNVGIGTTTPTSLTHLFKSAGDAILSIENTGHGNSSGIDFIRQRLSGASVTGGSIFIDSNTGANDSIMYIQAQSASAGSGVTGPLTANNGVRLKLATGGSSTDSAGVFSIENGATESFRINGSGNVGIGTSTPDQRLVVSTGTSGDSVLVVEADTDNSNEEDNPRFVLRQDGNLVNGIFGLMGTTAQFTGALANGLFIEAQEGTGNAIQFVTGATSIGGTNGVARMTIEETGDIGIGHSNPATILDISTGSNSDGLRLRGTASTTEIADMFVGPDGELILTTRNTGGSTAFVEVDAEDDSYGLIIRDSNTGTTDFANLYMNSATADYLNIVVGAANSATGLVIDENQDVGIGTTDPTAKFDVVGASTVDTEVTYGFFRGGGTTQPGLRLGGNNTTSSGNRYSFLQSISPSGSAFSLALNPNGGNVGIGTTTPEGLLNIYRGNSTVSAVNTAADELVIESNAIAGMSFLVPDSTGTANIYFGHNNDNDAGRIVYNMSDDSLDIFNSGAQTMKITGDGNIGIGTTTPWGKLSLTNTGAGPSFVVEDSSSPDTTPFIIDAAGNVGIGYATPTQKLEVNGSIVTAGNVLITDNTNGNLNALVRYGTYNFGYNLYMQSGNELVLTSGEGASTMQSTNHISGSSETLHLGSDQEIRFWTNLQNMSASASSTAAAILTTTGRFGIGTVSPTQLLDVEGDSGGRAAFTDTGTKRYSIGNGSSASFTIRDESLSTDRLTIDSNGIVSLANLLLTGSTTLQNFSFVNATGTNLFTTTSSSTNLFFHSGNGTTLSLSSSLAVAGGASFTGGRVSIDGTDHSVTSGENALFESGGTLNLSTRGSVQILLDNDNSQTNTAFSIGTDGSASGLFSVLETGNVGIASSTPWAKLSVTNTGSGPSFVVEDASSPDSTPFIISATGLVGIGTASPDQSLDVADNLDVGNATGEFIRLNPSGALTDDNYIDFTGTRAYVGYEGGNAMLQLQAGSGKGIIFAVDNATFGNGEVARITSTGRLGLGLTSPITKLNVDGGGFLLGSGTTRNDFYVSERVDRAATDNSSGTVWYKFATIPASASSNGPLLKISFVGGLYQYDDKVSFNANISTRDGFEADISDAVVGNSVNTAGIVAYEEADSSYSLYIKLTGGQFSTGQIMVQDGSYATGATFIDISDGSPSDTSTPTGTLVFDTTDTAYYTGLVYDYNDERVGIGRTDPSNILDIDTNAVADRGVRISDDAVTVALLNDLSATADEGGLQLYNEGSETVRIRAGSSGSFINSGNLGIGTTSPWAKLSVTNTGTAPSFVVEDSISPDSSPFIIDATGAVGIGTTSPQGKLHVSGTYGSQLLVGDPGAAGTINFRRGSDGSATAFMGWGSASEANEITFSNSSGGGYFTWDTNPSGSAVEQMRLTNGGFLGIGTTSPAAQLDVTTGTAGINGRVLLSPSNNNRTLTLGGGTGYASVDSTITNVGAAGNLVLNSSGGNVGIGTTTPWGVLAVTNTGSGLSFIVEDQSSPDSTPFVIDNNGNVGIGSSTPRYKMDIRGGNLAFDGGSLIFNDNGGTTNNVESIMTNDGGLTGINTTGVFSFHADTTVGVGASTPTAGLSAAGIYSSTKIGIGTTTPNQMLSIFQNGADAAIEFSTVSGESETWTIGIDDSAGAVFKIASSSALGTSDRFVIDGNGNIGIGDSTPDEKLQVAGDVHIDTTGSTIAGADIANAALLIGTGSLGIGIDTNEIYSEGSDLNIGTIGAFDIIMNAGGGQVTIGGSVGIGGIGAGLAYNAISDSGGATSHSLASDDDLYIEGDLETDGSFWADGAATFASTFTVSGSASGFGVADTTGHTLTIHGNGTGSGEGGEIQLRFSADNDSTTDGFNIDVNSDNFRIFNGTDVRFLIDGATGNVGIGEVAASPDVLLHVGSSTPNSIATGQMYRSAFISGDLEVDGTIYGSVSGTITPGFTQGSVVFADSSGNLAQDNASFFWDDSANELGIGTTTPNQALTIFKNGADAAIEFSTISGANETWTIGVDDSDASKFKIASSSALGTSDRFVIEGNGFVGIGDSSPDTRLEIIDTTAQLRLTHTDGVDDTTFAVDTNGDLTINLNATTGAGNLLFADADTFAFGGVAAGLGYHAISDSGGATSHALASDDDLFVEGDIELNGTLWADGAATFASTFTMNGSGVIGDGGDDIAINSNDWDISSAGVATGFTGITTSGTITASAATFSGIVTANNTFAANAAITLGDGGDSIIVDSSTWDVTSSGSIRAAFGDATAPGFSFAADTTAGFYRIADDRVGIVPGAGKLSAEFEIVNDGLDQRRIRMYGNGNTSAIPHLTHDSDITTGIRFAGSASPSLSKLFFEVDSATTMTIADGEVGIGTTNPESKLHITSTAGTNGLIIGEAGTNAKQLLLGYDTTNNYAAIQAVHQAVAFTNLVLNQSGGNVGIGTTTPESKFTVYGLDRIMTLNNDTVSGSISQNVGMELRAKATTSLQYIDFASNSSSTSTPDFDFRIRSDGASATFSILASTTPGSAAFQINRSSNVGILTLAAATGNALCYDTTTISGLNTFATCSSLRELKTDISSLSLGLDTLMQLNPTAFTDKKSGERRFGFIAEEVNAVNPVLSTYYEGKLRGVDYNGLTSLTIKSLQELNLIVGSTTVSLASLADALDERGLEIDQIKSDIAGLSEVASSTLAIVNDHMLRLSALESLISTTTASSTGLVISTSTPGFIASVLDAVKATVVDGVTHFVQLAVDSLSTYALTVGKSERPSGITVYDEDTGEPFCMKIKSGQQVSTPGACGTQANANAPQTGGNTEPIITPLEIFEETPSTETATTTTETVGSGDASSGSSETPTTEETVETTESTETTETAPESAETPSEPAESAPAAETPTESTPEPAPAPSESDTIAAQ